MLMALDWPLPQRVYAHSFWISEGQKMSKSMGNFIDLEKINHYVQTFGLDALRYFLATAGPMGTTDSDFAESRFIEVYNADLANTLGNCFSRVTKMIGRYFDGHVPKPGPEVHADTEYDHAAESAIAKLKTAFDQLQLDHAAAAGMELVRLTDTYIEKTQPYKLAKDPDRIGEVGTILYNCAEAIRIVSLALWPFMPSKMQQLWERLGCAHYAQALANRGTGQLDAWMQWGQIEPGTPLQQGDPLFPRYQA